MNIEVFRDNIFSENSSRFGKIAEVMIKKLYNFQHSESNYYDLSDNNKKIEVKFGRALKKNKETINEDNILSQLNNPIKNRMVSSKNIQESFDINIQQVKIAEFDELYYGVFFKDGVEIFKITNNEIKKDKNIKYSDKQHKGNVGEGQFHINNLTYEHHKEKYFQKFLSYEEVYKLFER